MQVRFCLFVSYLFYFHGLPLRHLPNKLQAELITAILKKNTQGTAEKNRKIILTEKAMFEAQMTDLVG